MKIFGYNMETNIKYKQGKTKLEQYVKEQNDLYQWYKDTIQRYNETVFDLPEFAGFEYNEAISFMRTWEIIQELPTEKKNLFLTYCATDYNYKETLEVFNGKRCYKNVATLRVLITLIRKIIKEKYKEKYGSN